MSNQTKQPLHNGHAVVIGGSIAGLLAARVLSDHYAQVTVIERDAFPAMPDFRTGAPHARHAHGLLVRGQQIMESYFPGLIEELEAQGAIPTNMGREGAFYLGGVPLQSFDSDLSLAICSRPLLEHSLRRRLLANERVRCLEGYDVTGLRTDAAGQRVTGVQTRRRGDATVAPETVAADLVVDASGRNSRLPDWLAELGFTPPTETTVDAQAGYATAVYRRPAEFRASWKALYSMPTAPHQRRGCIIVPLEGDRWHVTLTGLDGDHPPTDEAGFLAFSHSLPVPELHRALAQAEPLTAPYGYRRAANRLRHYDKLPRYLEGVLALGDAVAALNPVYGQGMTVAALGAVTLDESLRRQGDSVAGLARRYQRALAKVIAGPWQMATGQDLRWAGGGQRPDPITHLVQRYLDRVLVAMTVSAEVAAAFSMVQNMLASPAVLFRPRIVWQVFRATARRNTGSAASPVATPAVVEQVGM